MALPFVTRRSSFNLRRRVDRINIIPCVLRVHIVGRRNVVDNKLAWREFSLLCDVGMRDLQCGVCALAPRAMNMLIVYYTRSQFNATLR